jgi:hypothetical protein
LRPFGAGRSPGCSRRGRAAFRHRPTGGNNSSPPRPIRRAIRAVRVADAVLADRRSRSRRNRPPGAPSTSRHTCRDRCRHSPPSASRVPARTSCGAFLGGADEIVIGAAERLNHAAEDGGVPVGQLDRTANAFLRGGLLHLLPCSSVPVRKKTSLPSWRAKRASTSVAISSVGVTDMRNPVGIENRRRDVETFFGGHVGPFDMRIARCPALSDFLWK